jgi:transcriptional regulator with XRE-family HTH domain
MFLRDLRTSAGITQIGLARKAGVSKQHIMRIEQGLYSHVPESILDVYSTISSNSEFGFLTVTELERRYENELAVRHEELRQDIQDRSIAAGGWQNLLDSLQAQPSKGRRSGSNLLYFRSWLGFDSQIDFCRTFAAHPATVRNYEQSRSRKLPSDLRSGLLAAGVPSYVVEAL